MKRFNYYGTWIYNDQIGIDQSPNESIRKGDVINVYSKRGSLVWGTLERTGTPVALHHTYLTNGWFVRKSIFKGKRNG
jgi:hypothetical protein